MQRGRCRGCGDKIEKGALRLGERLPNPFAEDKLMEAIDAGIDQYVIVGAGYDSFSLRRPGLRERINIFEIDHPDTQREKRRRIAKLCDGALPANLSFLPVDFERESLTAGLARSAFKPMRPTFFSWLGTTPYLSNEAALESLRGMAEVAAGDGALQT